MAIFMAALIGFDGSLGVAFWQNFVVDEELHRSVVPPTDLIGEERF